MASLRRVALFGSIAVAAIGAYFSENIIGYYRYQQLCDTEGGLRIFHPLQMNVGWLSDEQVLGLSSVYGIGFARFEKDGKLFDRIYKGRGLVSLSDSYVEKPADIGVAVVYELRHFENPVPGHVRTHFSGEEVYEISTGRLMIRWTQVGYSKFDRDKTILAAPSGEACHSWGGFFEKSNAERYFGSE